MSISRNFSIAVVLLLATFAPGSASAEPEENPEDVVTVTATLNGADDDGEACLGFASIEASESSLTTSLSEIVPANPNPSLEWRFGFTERNLSDLQFGGTFINSESGQAEPMYPSVLEADDGSITSFTPNPTWLAQLRAAGEDWQGIFGILQDLDLNNDGTVSLSDPAPGGGEPVKRNYVSPNFTVTMDASSCPESEATAAVFAERSPVMWAPSVDASESDFVLAEYDFNNPPGAYTPGTAHLLSSADIFGGILNYPQVIARTHSEMRPQDLVSAGMSASRTMRAIISAHGNEPQGMLQTEFTFWLTPGNDYENDYAFFCTLEMITGIGIPGSCFGPQG